MASPTSGTGTTKPLLLVATDGGQSSAGAVRVARRLAELRGSDVELVTIAAPGQIPGQRVWELLTTTFECAPTWDHTILHGDLGLMVAEISHKRRATLVIVGLPSSGARASTMDLASAIGAPVLAVPPAADDLARRVLFATDFSRASLRAAVVALDLLRRPAHAVVVSARAERPHDGLESPVDMLLDAVEGALGMPRDVTFSRHRVEGETVSAVLRLAAAEQAELITIGRRNRRASPHERGMTLGHVGRGVLRTSTCSVLFGPSSPDA